MTDAHHTLAARIAFASYRNITIGTAGRLAARGIDATEFFALDRGTLASLTGLKPDYFDDARRAAALESARHEADFILSNSIRPIFYTDPDFPARLKDCEDAPAMLYVVGRPDFAIKHCVAVVGTRHATAYGADFTRRLVEDLAAKMEGVLIISGLAYGIDIAAHRAAMTADVPTAAVLAHGLNTIYPADHRDEAARIVRSGGFLVSEYRSDSKMHRGNFLARNRIVAGLADATVVVESDARGGAMSTARIAGAYNREVFAVPGRVSDPYSRGTNDLIARQQAIILRDADDLIASLGWETRPVEGTQQTLDFPLTDEQTKIVEFIRTNPAATVNDMCVALAMPYSALSSTLFQMEMEDLIISLPGSRYALPSKLSRS
ncbi:MAG: DNA-protecting protein DprA [Bacteroidales bacterium]|nr:DNA-protecting protein DprA [Bacteroidales bacterium]